MAASEILTMPPQHDSAFTGFLQAARQALENRELEAATRQVAAALGEDPNHIDALSLLDEIITTAPDPLTLIPDDDMPLTSTLAAVRCYLLAAEGDVAEAIHKLLEVVTERPDVLYIDWVLGWLQHPEATGKLDIEKVTEFVGSMLEQYAALTAPHGGGRETLTRMPLFIQLVRRIQPADAQFLSVSVALLRRMGCLDEALKLARDAYALEPDVQTALGVAATHAARDEVDQALEVYRDALAKEPTSVAARLSMADLLVNSDRMREAEALYGEILEREPNHELAEPSYYFLRFVTTSDESWQDKLLALAEEHPDNERAGRLAQRVTPYVGYLPAPLEVVMERSRASGGGGASSRNGGSVGWETPSSRLAFGRLAAAGANPEARPDPRLPRGRVDFLLWKYEGNQARVAVPSPDAEVAHAVVGMASQPFYLDLWW